MDDAELPLFLRAGRSAHAARVLRSARGHVRTRARWKARAATAPGEERAPTPAHDVERVPPRITIGLPVYNGERYLEDSVESILGQTYANFELLIVDNASSDGTERICRELCRLDSRVRYVRHSANIGVRVEPASPWRPHRKSLPAGCG